MKIKQNKAYLYYFYPVFFITTIKFASQTIITAVSFFPVPETNKDKYLQFSFKKIINETQLFKFKITLENHTRAI